MGSRYIFGISLVILGFLFFLDQLGVWSFGWIISTWWPIIIIIIGISHLASSNKSFFTGIVIIAIGVLLQADQLDYLPGGFWSSIWPLILILIGIWILTVKHQRSKRHPSNSEDVNILAMFSGASQIINSDNFKGGTIGAYFGGVELDLRNSKLASEGGFLELTAAFGGIEIRLPYDWKVFVTGTPIFGGMENKTRQEFPEGEVRPILKINYLATFGGIEIKN